MSFYCGSTLGSTEGLVKYTVDFDCVIKDHINYTVYFQYLKHVLLVFNVSVIMEDEENE